MKSPKELITALEEKATLEQIAFACKVKVKSVVNWRCQDEWKYDNGKNTVGEQSKELLFAFATSKGGGSMSCLLPQSEQAELRAGVSSAQAARDKTRSLLVQIFETAAPEVSQVELELFENYLDYFEADIESLISAQNVAIKAGLTAEGG